MTPYSIIFTFINSLFLLFLPRRMAVLPLIIASLYISLNEQLMIGSINFPVMRILILVGWLRIFTKREINIEKINHIDIAIIGWSILVISAGILRNISLSSMLFYFGIIYNSIGLYFLFRCLIHNLSEIKFFLIIFCLLLTPLAILMFFENITGFNLLSYFQSIPEFSQVRNGRVRAQGAFAHPILAGTVAAIFVPLIISLWFQSNNKMKPYSTIGIVSCVVIIFSSSSSGPLLTLLVSIIGMVFWRLSNDTKIIFFIILIGIISLQVVMNAPFWHILARLGSGMGSTGWHRAHLIDQSIKYFSEWWLCGTDYTRHWMTTGVSWSQDHSDITNQYLLIGVQGGIFSVIAFIIIIINSFKSINFCLKLEKGHHIEEKILIWSFGVSLAAFCSSFISVALFDQTIVFWYLVLSMISIGKNDFEKMKEHL